MKKKILSLLLSMAMIFSFSLAALADVRGSDDATCSERDKTLNEAVDGSMSVGTGTSVEMITEIPKLSDVWDQETIDKYVVETQGDPDAYLKWQKRVFAFSDEMLLASTEELLTCFLGSPYMQDVTLCGYASSIPDHLRPIRDFSEHIAFAELLTRDDLSSVLCEFEEKLSENPYSLEYRALKKVMEQPTVKELFINLEKE